MQTKTEMLMDLRDEYRRLWKILKNKKPSALDGHLVIARSRKTPQYFHCFRDPKTGREQRVYLRLEKRNLACLLAQKSYDKKAKSLVEKRLRRLEQVCLDFSEDEVEKLWEELIPERRDLVMPIQKPWIRQVEEWMAQPYKAPPLGFPTLGLTTKKGETVRSKTEKILADLFNDQNIPYKYECPLRLEQKWWYPDFTFLSPYTKEEVYWEHHGMVDDEIYMNRMIQKIMVYEQNGISPGKNLILTFETKTQPLNLHWVQQLIDRTLVKP